MDRTVEELESQVARLASALDGAKRGHKYWYEKNRLLENRIRNAIRIGEQIDTDALYSLATSVPKTPRKKMGMGNITLRGRKR